MDSDLEVRIAGLRDGSEDGVRHSFSDIGNILGISKDKAQKIHKKSTEPELPKPSKPLPPITLTGNVAVVGDVHVPDLRWDVCEKVAVFAKRFEIKTLVLAGDLGNFDQFSRYKALTPNPEFSREIKGCSDLINMWLDAFDMIYWCRGNHDSRSIESTDGKLNMDLLANMILPGGKRDRLVTSMYNGIWLKTKSGKFLLAHQKEYSKQKLVVAQRLSEMYHCHVVTHHQHHAAVGMDRTNRYMIADNGCLCDAEKIAYKSLNYSTSNEFNIGFALIHNGHYLPYVEGACWGIK